ncbi:TPA: hypothetical protein ACH3X1_012494 [Trebouxia sp. C0004]
MAYSLLPNPPAISCCRLCSFNSSLPSRGGLCQPCLALPTGAVCTEQGSVFLMPGSHARIPAASMPLPPFSHISVESSPQQHSQHQTMSTVLRVKPTIGVTSNMHHRYMQRKHEPPYQDAQRDVPLDLE